MRQALQWSNPSRRLIDSAGNLIANSDRNISQITYDHRNLAQRIKTDNGMHSYTYNHEGLRIGKQYSPAGQDDWSVNTRYVYGAYGELLAQYDGLLHQYWNISTPEGETIGRMEASPPESKDDILAMNAGTFTAYDRYYYLKDHLGSIRVTLKDNGSVAGYDDYYPFGLQMPGRSSNTANTHADQITCPDASGFTGHFLESEGNLGLYHAQARLYDPEVPRFYGVDAMRGNMPGWNPYHYTFNNPIRFVDPDGNNPELARVLRNTFGWLENPVNKKVDQLAQLRSNSRLDLKFNPQAITDIKEGSGKMVSGFYAARSNFNVDNVDTMLEGTQQLFDGVAEVSGTVENISAIATISGNPKAAASFAGASAISSASDGISTGVEVIRYFTSDDVSAVTVGNRVGWTLFNNNIPGRVPSIYQGRDDLQETLIEAGVKETEKAINQ